MATVVDAIWPYVLMSVTAFGAATLLPFSSEVALIAQIKAGLGSPWWLVAAATVGNVGGSLFNWWVGGALRRFEGRRWFPFKSADIAAATTRFNSYGVWILLLAWVPVVGDPLTLVAGVLRVPLRVFLPLVAVGKCARYAVIAWFL
jgi:membrane protein YqaA with SNARE-associated domain